MSIFNEFPYTNFHEMNLDWILAKVKELAAEWLSYKENMELWKADTEAAFRELKTYVMNYFANLDVDEEISDKLDQMLADGDLNSIIAPAVAEWLEQYITPTTPVIDTSFTISGAGADSKTVGDKTHWYRGHLSSGLMSDCKSNGWWVVNEIYSPSDSPVTITDVSWLHVYATNSRATQFLQLIDGREYIRDITYGSPDVVGNWRDISAQHFTYHGRIRNGDGTVLLSNYKKNGWYYIYNDTFNDEPWPDNNNYWFLINRETGFGIQQEALDIYGRQIKYRWITTGGSVGVWNQTDALYQSFTFNRAKFVEEMNKWCVRLNLNDTVFADANGISRDNLTTAYDLCRMGGFASCIDSLTRIASRRATTIYDGDTARPINNSTDFDMLDGYDVIFTKTGYLETNPIVCNLVTVARHKETGIRIVGAVMNCASTDARFTAMKQLLDRTMEVVQGQTPTVTVTDCDNYCSGVMSDGSSVVQIVSTKNHMVQIPTASTAKVMTAIIAATYTKALGSKLLVRSSAQAGGSGNNLTTGSRVTVADLIADMLLPSSNTAANVIADYIGDYIYKGSQY